MHSSADSTQDDGNDRISATSTDCSSLCHSTKSTEVKLRSCSDDEALNWDGASDDMDDSGQIRTERTRTCWRSSIFNKARCCGDQSADLPVKPRERVLKLSRVGLDNDTLNKVSDRYHGVLPVLCTMSGQQYLCHFAAAYNYRGSNSTCFVNFRQMAWQTVFKAQAHYFM